jgi:hypothetical protein
VLLAALEADEATGEPLPVQVHTGFGDSDLHLPRADAGFLRLLVERLPYTPFVLLAGWPRPGERLLRSLAGDPVRVATLGGAP